MLTPWPICSKAARTRSAPCFQSCSCMSVTIWISFCGAFMASAIDAGLLYVADVGQDEWEEVTIVPASAGGLNHGWNLMEGNHCFIDSNCDAAGLVAPAYEYDHDEGCSITGGLVYRGAAIAALTGHYLFSDYCAGFLRSLRYADGVVAEIAQWSVGDIGRVTSFGQDAAGELYITNSDGEVLKLVPGP